MNAIERFTEAMATTKPHMASQREVCFPREPAQNPLAPPQRPVVSPEQIHERQLNTTTSLTNPYRTWPRCAGRGRPRSRRRRTFAGNSTAVPVR